LINEGTGGYISSGYVSAGYVTAQTTMNDTINGKLAATRTASQTLTITDDIPNLFITRSISQIVNSIHSISRKLTATREISTGSGGYTSTGYTDSGYLVANITDITESLARVRDVPRTLSETITDSDSIVRLYAALRTISRTITTTESISRLYAALRTISPTVTITETLSRQLAALRTLTQSLSITELITAFKGIAGSGARRIKEATTSLFKRSGMTTIFKRSANTTA